MRTPQNIKSDLERYFILSSILLITLLFFSSIASAAETTCTPSNLAVFDNRIHVKCAEAVGGIQYFAVSTADSAKAARILSVINSAIVTGRPLFVFYDPADTSGASIGCQSNDCRIIDAIGFWQ